MNMKFGKFAVLGAALAASLSLTANAATVSGTVYEGVSLPSVPVDPLGVSYTGLAVCPGVCVPTTSFTLTNASSTGLFNFFSATDGPGVVGGLTSFLTTTPASTPNGNTVTGIPPGNANDGINNDLFQFMGTVTLQDTEYTFLHDDGMTLYLNGALVINDPALTPASTTFFDVVASGVNNNNCTTGGSHCTFVSAPGATYNFTLDYSEVNGAPAELVTNIPLTSPVNPIPEPNSLMLLGTGLVSAAGMFFRKFQTA